LTVPPGPGVQPPFVAPPTDGARQRRGWAIGLTIAAALLCCVGGLGGLGGLVVLGGQAIVGETRTAVTRYLTAVEKNDYAAAYRMLCDTERQRQTQDEFAGEQSRRPLTSFTVEEPVIADDIEVPASLTYGDGQVDHVRFLLAQNQSGQFEVCGTTG
jgi:hypothetical protein